MFAFFDKLKHRAESTDSWVCVGLDPTKVPASLVGQEQPLVKFLLPIIEATLDVACCYKPNLAFYLAAGMDGMRALAEVRHAIPADVPVILDAKSGDIGSTAAAYAEAAFNTWGFDAVTVNPFVGEEAVLPFSAHNDKGLFVLAKTSNKDSGRFQDHHELWLKVVESCNQWNSAGNIGLVVGATHPTWLERIRTAAPTLPFLIPGIGAQGGDLAAAVSFGATDGNVPPVINSSRGILYASNGSDFAAAARQATIKLRDQIRVAKQGVSNG